MWLIKDPHYKQLLWHHTQSFDPFLKGRINPKSKNPNQTAHCKVCGLSRVAKPSLIERGIVAGFLSATSEEPFRFIMLYEKKGIYTGDIFQAGQFTRKLCRWIHSTAVKQGQYALFIKG